MIHSTTAPNNTYIEQLENILPEGTNEVDYLIIAHPDDRMLGALSRAFGESKLAVLTIPQSDWNFDNKEEQEVVQWSIRELGVKGVLLAGHSQGGIPQDPVRLVNGYAEPPAELPMNRVHSLFQRVQQAREGVAKCEQHIADQYQYLRNQSGIASQTSSDSVELQGLLYRAESGIFCTFDPQTGSFEALIDDACIL